MTRFEMSIEDAQKIAAGISATDTSRAGTMACALYSAIDTLVLSANHSGNIIVYVATESAGIMYGWLNGL